MTSAFKALEKDVYPNLDAVSSGLLDNLNPGPLRGDHYSLRCPFCNKQRGYYYVGQKYIRCNRKEECGESISIYDYLSEYNGLEAPKALETLFQASGKLLPKQPITKRKTTALEVFKKVTRYFLDKNPQVTEIISADRKIDPSDLYAIDSGYVPDITRLLKALKKYGISTQNLIDEGLLKDDFSESYLKDRYLVFWNMSSSKEGFCAYAYNRSKTKSTAQPKYLFSPGFKKTIPYLFLNKIAPNHQKNYVCVEGIWDAWSVRWCTDHIGVAIGGGEIIASQAEFFSSKSITVITHVIDSDIAGFIGGVRSILNCAKFGIRCFIGVLPEGSGDPDDARQNGQVKSLKEACDNPLSPGDYISKVITYAAKNNEDKLFTTAFKAIHDLLPQDLIKCRHNINTTDNSINSDIKAAEFLYSLVISGESFRSSLDLTAKRYPLLEVNLER